MARFRIKQRHFKKETYLKDTSIISSKTNTLITSTEKNICSRIVCLTDTSIYRWNYQVRKQEKLSYLSSKLSTVSISARLNIHARLCNFWLFKGIFLYRHTLTAKVLQARKGVLPTSRISGHWMKDIYLAMGSFVYLWLRWPIKSKDHGHVWAWGKRPANNSKLVSDKINTYITAGLLKWAK